MNLHSVQLIGIDLEGFKSIIRSVVAKVLQEDLKIIFENFNPPPDEFLTRQEAANFLRISETKLWELDKSQKLPARRLDGKVLYLKSDLLNFSD